jgi:hypothetical protein
MTSSPPHAALRLRPPRTIAALLALVALAGCVRSTTPILTDARPLLGQTVRFTHYDLREGVAHDPDASEFHWDGTRYVGTVGTSKDPAAFTVFPFEGRDFIIQNAPTKKDVPIEYAIARKLADGVYLTFLIDESDADAATKTKLCVELDAATCTIVDREALEVFARASAAKLRDTGGLAIRLPDDKADNK